MAKRKSVNIDINFPSKKEVNDKLNTLVSQLSKVKTDINLDLDTKAFNKSISEMSDLLTKLKRQLANFNTVEQINIDTSQINKSTDAIKEQNQQLVEQKRIKEELLKTSTTTTRMPDGTIALNKELRVTRDEYGNIITLVDNYNKKTGELSNTVMTVTNEVEKNKKAQEASLRVLDEFRTKMQGKLDKVEGNGFIDVGIIREMQRSLNSINVDTPKSKLKELESAINNLGSSDKNIVRVQNAILKMEDGLTSLKNKYGNLVGNSDSINELKKYEQELEKLRKILKDLTNGKTFDGSKISSELGNSTHASRQLTNAVKGSSNALKLATKDATSYGDAFKGIFTKISLASVSYKVISELSRSFREGFQSVVEVDSALTNISITMNTTTSELNELVTASKSLARELGNTSVEILKIAQVYANANESVNSILEKVKPTAVLGNLTGMDVGTVTSIVQGIIQQFDLLDTDIAKTSQGISDSLVTISQQMAMDFGLGVRTMAEGIAASGSMAKEAGYDMQEYASLIGSVAERTRQSGSEIGNAMKMIMSRFGRVTSEDGADAESISKTEKVLASLGITIRDKVTNEFRNFQDVIDDLTPKWEKLDSVTKSQVATELAGARQKNVFLNLMEAQTRQSYMYSQALESEGSSLQANEIYMNSIEGKMKQLSESAMAFWQTFISSDVVKGGIDLLTNLIRALDGVQNKFGSSSLAIGGLTGAFMMFTNNPLKKFISGITGIDKNLTNANKGMTTASNGAKSMGTAFSIATVKATAMNIALSAITSVGIGLVVSGLTWLVGKLNETSDTVEETADKIKELNDISNGRTEVGLNLSQYENLLSKLEDEKLESEEIKKVQEEIEQVKTNIANAETSYQNILESTTLSEKEKLDIIKKQEEVKSLQKAKEIADNMMSSSKMQSEANMLMDTAEKLKQARLTLKEMEDELKSSDADDKTKERYNALKEEINNLTLELLNGKEKVEVYNSSLKSVQEQGYHLNDSIVELDGSTKSFINSLIYEQDTLSKTTKEQEKLNEAKRTSIEMYDAQANLSTATQSYSGSIQELDKMRSLIAEINEEQAMTPAIIESIASSYPDVGTRITSVTETIDFLNQKIYEQEEVTRQAYAQMIMNDENYYKNKILNNEMFSNYFTTFLNSMLGQTSEAYNLDLTQFSTLQELKMSLQNQFGGATGDFLNSFLDVFASAYTFDATQFADLQSMKEAYMNQTLGAVANWIARYTGGNAEAYKHDLMSFQTLAQRKAYVLGELNKKMQKLQSNYNELLSNAQALARETGDPTFMMNGALANTRKQIDSLNLAIGSVDTMFSGLNSTLNGYVTNFKPIKFNGGSVGKPSGSSGGKKPSVGGKTDAEKEAEERIKAEEEANRVIYDMRKKLVDLLRKQYQELRDKEIGLIDEEIEELKKQLDALENGYSSEGEKLQKLKEELAKWEKDDSEYSQKKQAELREEIAKQELRVQIEAKEEEKKLAEEKWESILDNQKLYQEADLMLKNQQFDKITELFKKYGDLFTETTGSISDYIKSMIDSLKNAQGMVGNLGGQSKNPSKPSGVSSKPSSPSGGGGGSINRGTAVKVTDVNSAIYTSSDSKRSSGTWRGAGVKNGDKLYVVNTSSGRYALSRTNSINGAIGWIEKSKIARFNIGGKIPSSVGNNGALGVLDKNERVLTDRQTRAFDKFVYDYLPRMILPFNEKLKEIGDIIFAPNITIECDSRVDLEVFKRSLTKDWMRELKKLGIKTK